MSETKRPRHMHRGESMERFMLRWKAYALDQETRLAASEKRAEAWKRLAEVSDRSMEDYSVNDLFAAREAVNKLEGKDV